MALRVNSPRNIFTSVTTNTATNNQTFLINPIDISSLVFKLQVASITGTAPTLDVYIQTTDDGGTTFYDVAHFAQVTAAITNANALFLTVPINGGDGGYVGGSASGTIAAGTVNKLPFLSNLVRIRAVMGGTVTAVNWQIDVYAQSQDAHA